ncbi:undecaprenyl/decaprenyl-phosphate alpha-N-acetylglucosaminyl 1-phosphate transferase [Candidatus Dojkabacteria bacterium]|nr:undecaprenyl/decaprenyl-phosphate alpha-N-acetylglucosaminyl 1-phosphate transferase [Candidatus Dojkabacteria bacterium]
MNYLITTLKPYLEYLPYFATALLSAFLLTPIIGFIANKLKIVDLPAGMRKSTDPTKKTRMKKTVILRAGGLAVIVPFIIILLVAHPVDKQIGAIIVGVIILTITGVLDDKYEVSSRYQSIAQVLAALVVVAAGISIDSIQSPFDTSVNLRSLVLPFTLGNNSYSIALPADILTIIWILIMINAVNWIFGIDGLGEGISFIAFMTILFISVKFENPLPALLASIAAGGILGFLPFNLPPSKIISGTSVTVYGFLIAVLSILGGVKVSTSVIVLAIPLLDMIWVMVGRINRAGANNIMDVFKVTTVGDDTHLHHRLLKLGLSVPQVTLVECIAVGICAIIAFSTAGLPKVTTISIISVIVLIVFLGISFLLKRGVSVTRRRGVDSGGGESVGVPGEPETPESRYAY